MKQCCQLSVVRCQLLWIRIPVFGAFSCSWTNRFEVAVQFGTEFVDKWLKLFDVDRFEHSASVGSTEEVFRLIQRTAGGADEAPVVGKAASPCSFGNISSNTICSANKLQANGLFLEPLPTGYESPNLIGYFFSKLVHPKFLKISPQSEQTWQSRMIFATNY